MSILLHIFWALANSIWQSAALAAIVFAVLRCMRRTTAGQRYAVWGAVLVASALLPAVDFALSEGAVAGQRSHAVVQFKVPARVAAPTHEIAVKLNQPQMAALSNAAAAAQVVWLNQSLASRTLGQPQPVANERRFAQFTQRLVSWLATHYALLALLALALWVAVTYLLLARLTLGYIALRAIKASLSYRQLTRPEQQVLGTMTSRPVTIGYSLAMDEPCVIGFKRPVIVLPILLTKSLPALDTIRVLRHECAHVSRWDDYGNLLQQLIGVLLFFSPAVHFVSKALDIEREIACDDAVASAAAERAEFARCLYELAQTNLRRKWLPATGFIRSKKHIILRVAQLLDREHMASTRLSALAKLGALSVILAAVPFAYVQVAAKAAPSQPAAATSVSFAPETAPAATACPLSASRAIGPKTISHVAAVVLKAELHATRLHSHVHQDSAAASRLEAVARELARDNMHVNFASAMRMTAHARELARENMQVNTARAVRLTVVARELSRENMRANLDNMHADLLVAAANAKVHAIAWKSGDLPPILIRAPLPAVVVYPVPLALAAAAVAAKSSSRDEHDEFLQALHDAGFRGLSVDDLIAIRNSGVSGSFLRELHAAGLTPMPAAELIELANAGVDARFLADAHRLGYGNLSTKEMVSLCNAGVSASYLASLSKYGYSHLPVSEIEALANAGVDPRYIAALAKVGYPHLSVPDLIALADNGVTAEFIARVTASGVSASRQLPVKDLIRLSDEGI